MNAAGQTILLRNKHKQNYSTLSKSKLLDGRGGISAVSLCQPPPLSETIELCSRTGTAAKNQSVSRRVMKMKDGKRTSWLRTYGREISDFTTWQRVKPTITAVGSGKNRLRLLEKA